VLEYGYNVGEVPLPGIGELKEGTVFRADTGQGPQGFRQPEAVSTGAHVRSVTLPKPNRKDNISTRAGAAKRFAQKTPIPNWGLIRKLREFTRVWVRRHLVPIGSDADTSFEAWLANTDYPDWRKDELREIQSKVQSIEHVLKNTKWWKVKSFVKDEWYIDYKFPRIINARCDEFKVVVGPIFKLIEEQLYKHPAFIKHVPVCDRPAYITERLQGSTGVYIATDYTSFEALFTRHMMEAVEFELYDYMTSMLPEGPMFRELVHKVLGGTNFCCFRDFVVELAATRMSGEMCTSLGNGFSNLIFMEFVCSLKSSTVIGVVEGDDGLFHVVGVPPTAEDFAAIGLVIKLEIHTEISTASFCGIVFDPEDKINVADPRKILATFGWASAVYAKARRSRLHALLRCKALSLAHQYPGMPIVQALSQYGLRATRGQSLEWAAKTLKNNASTRWQSRGFEEMIRKPIPVREVGLRTRILVERLYGISPSIQVEIEKYLDGLNGVQELDHELIRFVMPSVWLRHSAKYVLSVPLARTFRMPDEFWLSTTVQEERDRVTALTGAMNLAVRLPPSHGR